jgi:hypothetical protein
MARRRRPPAGRDCRRKVSYRLMNPISILLPLALLSGPAAGQGDDAEQRAKEIEAYCSKAHCRPAQTVRLRREDGSTFERPVPRLPIVLPNGWITIFPGEEVHVELTVAGNAIRSARAVPKVVRPKTTLTFRLRQPPESTAMVLAVSHGLPQAIKYSVDLMLPAGGDMLPAASCPVQPEVITNETWPEPVFQLVIKDLRFLREGASLSCGR